MTVIETKKRINALKNVIRVAEDVINDILKKVVINAEFVAAGDEAPYNSAELHNSAQVQRNIIKDAQAELDELE